MGKENLDRFNEQLTSLLHSSGVSPRFCVTYLKQQTQKDAWHMTPSLKLKNNTNISWVIHRIKRHQQSSQNILMLVWKLYEINMANRGINKLETYYISIRPCNRETKNPSLSFLIVLHKPSWNWRSWFQILIDYLPQRMQKIAVNSNNTRFCDKAFIGPHRKGFAVQRI